MIKEIKPEKYERDNIIFDKMKRNLKKYTELDIIDTPNSWDIIRYFQLIHGNSQKLIKREKNRFIITSTKIGEPPHIYIIKHDDSGKIIEFINYCDKDDGFHLTIHKKLRYGATIIVYEKKGSNIVKTSYSPRSAYLKIPEINISDNANRSIITYKFEEPNYENPNNVSVLKNCSLLADYQRRNDGCYYLGSHKFLHNLYHIFTPSKGINLQQVYQKLNISEDHQYSSKFFEIFKQAINNTTTIYIPTELQETLNALPTSFLSYAPLLSTDIPTISSTKSKKDFDSDTGAEYIN